MADLQHVAGLSALEKALREFAPKLRKQTLAAAVGAGAVLIRDEAKAIAPVYTGSVAKGHPPPGTLRKSIIMKMIPERSSSNKGTYFITIRRGKKDKFGIKDRSSDAYYWSFVEFGTVKMNAQPFMRPAYIARRQQAIAAFAEKIRSGVRDALPPQP